ncbi:catechol 1,2-dioxygenase [Algoriphagus sp. C2-6-M1]|uniref:dioxygenase family protein n=1 Tax=Algoriphagus persicinus TaxID=3108754 RepID=UPI002B3C8908|nr:catechol 1,2-dioxygenase [Algoriphagus sp. C2-6-M1]MEB2780050.1 catechol 1,2-dioxygenase [Algoriphagus sp. C2-6-M1]
MKRRHFVRISVLSVTAISAFGFIRYDGEKYVADCATTSDILGPFYRPASPVRTNFRRPGEKGKNVDLSGKILHQDCTTPYQNAKVELWHCDAEGVYDNSTDEFKYRGTVITDAEGNYAFQTILPVPYDAGGGLIRPAHYHMMVTAEGYQPLVTQLYFTGDKNIEKDPWASKAKGRILDVQDNPNGTIKVIFDVGMAQTLAIETASIDKLIGTYIDENDPQKTLILFKNKNALWVKNEVFGEGYEYAGNNLFVYPSNPEGSFDKLEFEIIPSGSIRLTHSFQYVDLGKATHVYIKKI